jgi:hypothetical protein
VQMSRVGRWMGPGVCVVMASRRVDEKGGVKNEHLDREKNRHGGTV